jgi:hypothetical protein
MLLKKYGVAKNGGNELHRPSIILGICGIIQTRIPCAKCIFASGKRKI